MFGGGGYRVAPGHNSETTGQFFGNVAKSSKISEERHHTNDDCVHGHININSAFKDT
jgi:hypothetical protein